MVKTCPYCASDVKSKPNSDKADCTFCEMEITPSIDGNRPSQKDFKKIILPEHIDLPTKDLMGWNTYNLLQILKTLRENRREYFNHVRTFKIAGNETDQFKEVAKQAGDEYEKITRKTWAVENILRDRIGYVPQRVTENTLSNAYQRMFDKRNHKPMAIRRSSELQPKQREPTLER